MSIFDERRQWVCALLRASFLFTAIGPFQIVGSLTESSGIHADGGQISVSASYDNANSLLVPVLTSSQTRVLTTNSTTNASGTTNSTTNAETSITKEKSISAAALGPLIGLFIVGICLYTTIKRMAKSDTKRISKNEGAEWIPITESKKGTSNAVFDSTSMHVTAQRNNREKAANNSSGTTAGRVEMEKANTVPHNTSKGPFSGTVSCNSTAGTKPSRIPYDGNGLIKPAVYGDMGSSKTKIRYAETTANNSRNSIRRKTDEKPIVVSPSSRTYIAPSGKTYMDTQFYDGNDGTLAYGNGGNTQSDVDDTNYSGEMRLFSHDQYETYRYESSLDMHFTSLNNDDANRTYGAASHSRSWESDTWDTPVKLLRTADANDIREEEKNPAQRKWDSLFGNRMTPQLREDLGYGSLHAKNIKNQIQKLEREQLLALIEGNLNINVACKPGTTRTELVRIVHRKFQNCKL